MSSECGLPSVPAVPELSEEDRGKKIIVLDCGGTISSRYVHGVYQPDSNVIHDFLENHIPHMLPHVVYHHLATFDSSDIDYPKLQLILSAVEDTFKFGYRGVVITHGTDTLAFTSALLTFSFDYVPIPVVLTASQIPLIEPMSDGRGNLFGSMVVAFGNNSLCSAEGTVEYEYEWLLPEVMVFMTHNLLLGSRIMKYNATEVQAFIQRNDGRIGSFIHKFISNPVQQYEIITRTLFNAIRFHYCLIESGDDLEFPLMSFEAFNRLKISTQGENVVNDHLPPNEVKRRLKHISKFNLMREVETKKFESLLRNSVPPKIFSPTTPVGVIRLFPGITEEILDSVANISLENGLRCIVISAFGAGNGPRVVKQWIIKHKLTTFVVVCTQCPAGAVSPDYAASLACDVGKDGVVTYLQNVALCDDLTLEAAVGKLSVYFNYFTQDKICNRMIVHLHHLIPSSEPSTFTVLKHQMEKSVRGELTGLSKW